MVGSFKEDKRPVALLPGPRGFELYDPGTGAKTLVAEKLAGKLNGFAYVFYRPFPPQALTVRDIVSFGLRDCRGDAATILLMGIATGLLGIATPVYAGIIFNTVIPGAQRPALAELSIFLVISAVAAALFTLTRALATLRLPSKMEASIQAALWDRLLA
jgi:ATP-binding cassette subfamily C protein